MCVCSIETHTCVYIHTYMYMNTSVIETRQSKATTPEDNSLFLKRKRRAALGGTQTRNVLHTRQTLYQLSHRGSSAGQAESLNVMQRQSRLSPDKQVNSISVLYMFMNMYMNTSVVETRQHKATTPENRSFFPEKK